MPNDAPPRRRLSVATSRARSPRPPPSPKPRSSRGGGGVVIKHATALKKSPRPSMSSARASSPPPTLSSSSPRRRDDDRGGGGVVPKSQPASPLRRRSRSLSVTAAGGEGGIAAAMGGVEEVKRAAAPGGMAPIGAARPPDSPRRRPKSPTAAAAVVVVKSEKAPPIIRPTMRPDNDNAPQPPPPLRRPKSPTAAAAVDNNQPNRNPPRSPVSAVVRRRQNSPLPPRRPRSPLAAAIAVMPPPQPQNRRHDNNDASFDRRPPPPQQQPRRGGDYIPEVRPRAQSGGRVGRRGGGASADMLAVTPPPPPPPPPRRSRSRGRPPPPPPMQQINRAVSAPRPPRPPPPPPPPQFAEAAVGGDQRRYPKPPASPPRNRSSSPLPQPQHQNKRTTSAKPTPPPPLPKRFSHERSSLFRIAIELDSYKKRIVRNFNALVGPTRSLFVSGPTYMSVIQLRDGRFAFVVGDVSSGNPSTQLPLDIRIANAMRRVIGRPANRAEPLAEFVMRAIRSPIAHITGYRDVVLESYVVSPSEMPTGDAVRWREKVTAEPYASVSGALGVWTDAGEPPPDRVRVSRIDPNRVLGGPPLGNVKSFLGAHVIAPAARLANLLVEMASVFNAPAGFTQAARAANEERRDRFRSSLNSETAMNDLTSVTMLTRDDVAQVMRAYSVCDRPFQECIKSIVERTPETRSMAATAIRNASAETTSSYSASAEYHRRLQSDISGTPIYDVADIFSSIERAAHKVYADYHNALETELTTDGLGVPPRIKLREFGVAVDRDPVAFISAPTLHLAPKSISVAAGAIERLRDAAIRLDNLYLIVAPTLFRILRNSTSETSAEVWIIADDGNARFFTDFFKHSGGKLISEVSSASMTDKLISIPALRV